MSQMTIIGGHIAPVRPASSQLGLLALFRTLQGFPDQPFRVFWIGGSGPSDQRFRAFWIAVEGFLVRVQAVPNRFRT